MATFRLLGGLAVSELTMLSTEDVLLDRDCSCGRLLVNSSIWKYRIIVHINPRTMEGRPSAISVELMLTNFICLKEKNCASDGLEAYRPFNRAISSTLLAINTIWSCLCSDAQEWDEPSKQTSTQFQWTFQGHSLGAHEKNNYRRNFKNLLNVEKI